jgi:hypothetical protein
VDPRSSLDIKKYLKLSRKMLSYYEISILDMCSCYEEAGMPESGLFLSKVYYQMLSVVGLLAKQLHLGMDVKEAEVVDRTEQAVKEEKGDYVAEVYAQLERSQFVLRSLDKIIKKESNVDLESLEQMENVSFCGLFIGNTTRQGKSAEHHLFLSLEPSLRIARPARLAQPIHKRLLQSHLIAYPRLEMANLIPGHLLRHLKMEHRIIAPKTPINLLQNHASLLASPPPSPPDQHKNPHSEHRHSNRHLLPVLGHVAVLHPAERGGELVGRDQRHEDYHGGDEVGYLQAQ